MLKLKNVSQHDLRINGSHHQQLQCSTLIVTEASHFRRRKDTSGGFCVFFSVLMRPFGLPSPFASPDSSSASSCKSPFASEAQPKKSISVFSASLQCTTWCKRRVYYVYMYDYASKSSDQPSLRALTAVATHRVASVARNACCTVASVAHNATPRNTLRTAMQTWHCHHTTPLQEL